MMPLYNPVTLVEYPQVPTYDDLPAAADNAGKIYVVLTPTGVWPFTRRRAGMWRSDGASWTRLGEVPMLSDLCSPAQGGFKITNMYVNAAGKAVVEYDDGQ
jgi:hypothetical protein